MSDNENVSKLRVPVTVGILSVPMLLDSIILWLSFVLLYFVHTRWTRGISDVAATYGFIVLIPWVIAHIIFVVGGIIVKLVCKKKKWLGSIGMWLCLISSLHVNVRVFPLVAVFFCEFISSISV